MEHDLVEAAKELMRRYESRERMGEWVKYLDLGFEFALHHKLVMRELELVEAGETQNLMLMLPPGSAKSTYASVLFPAWYLGRNPKRSVIAASHTLELAERFGRRVRNIVGGQEFRNVFDGGGLSPDSQAAGRWETIAGGEYFSAGVGGSITGRRADLGIIDDPVKSREDADSELRRESTWQWYVNDFLTRLKPGARQILVQCMTGDTEVLMADGRSVFLRDIKPNDAVASYENGRLVNTRVVDLRSQGKDDIYEIRTRLGGKLKANLRHPFLVSSDEGVSWKRLADLQIGDCLMRVRNGGIGGIRNAPSATSLQSAKACVTRTITKHGGQRGLDRRLATPLIDALQESRTGISSLLTSIKGFLTHRAGFALFANQPITALNTGTTSFALTTVTTKAGCADFYATVATCLSGAALRLKSSTPPQSTSDFIEDEIVDISYAGRDEVFDVQIANTENFIANGCASHNTRWHEDDLAGRILAQAPEEWKIVTIPMEAEANDLLGRKEGELLWPEWFTDEMVTRAKRDPRSWFALYQQQPRPMGGGEFRREWVNTYSGSPDAMKDSTNRYLLVDAANEKRKSNDYTAMWVLGLGEDDNIYVLDLVRDRLNLTERCNEVMRLHRKWKPREVRYEKYGMMADIDHIKFIQAQQKYRFAIQEVGGQTPKNDRIRRLIPYYEEGRVWFPDTIHRTMHDGITRELVNDFIEQELLAFPVGRHDDMLDAMARLIEPDLALIWPKIDVEPKNERYSRKRRQGSVWTA